MFGLACTQGQGLSGRVRIVLRKGGAVSHDRAPWEGVRGARRLDFLAGSGCRHKRRVGDAEMRGTCSAIFYAINGCAALHGAMDMAG